MRTDGLSEASDSMPTAKGKDGTTTSHRYRPASQYDNATLAQKREYWRNKKREQRARHRPSQDIGGKELLHQSAPAVVNASLSGSFAAFSAPLQSKDESFKMAHVSPASVQSDKTVGDSSVEAIESQKEKWLQTMQLNKVLPASCSKVKCLGAVSRAVTSATPCGSQPNTTSSSVPPDRVTRITNGSSTNATPQPCVSIQGATQRKAQVASRFHPKLLPAKVTTVKIRASSPCVPIAMKSTGNTTPQGETKSALVTPRRAKGVSISQTCRESEEERAAKRREQWRVKKREQRAKVAARIAKVRERTKQGQTAQKTGLAGKAILQHPPSRLFMRRSGQTQCPPRLGTSFTPFKRENHELRSGSASLATANLRADQIKVQNPHGNRTDRQPDVPSNVISIKNPGESWRKSPAYLNLSNVSKGIARFKTPRQRFIEAQKNITNQRNIRCKSALLACFGTRNIPKIDPDDTPEQILAKRREYWRVKKREQRAKLSMDVKDRLKEKDSLMRRVKRYQTIMEDMRRARALAQSRGSALTHTRASETIGGFIKEDGTVTISIPQAPTEYSTAAHKSEEQLCVGSNSTSITKPQHQPDTNRRGVAPVRVNPPLNPPPPLLHQAQVRVTFPLAGQSVNKPPKLVPIRPRTQVESTAVPNSHTLVIQTVGQLRLTHPPTPQNRVSGGSTEGSSLGGCVMKMAVSSSAPSLSALSLDPELTEEERMAKKREYWRVKKREQRAVRATRLKLGVLQARANAASQRRKTQKQVSVTSTPPSRRLTNHAGNAQSPPIDSVPVTTHSNEIKQERDNMPEIDPISQPEEAICPDIKPPTPPPPALKPEPEPAVHVDSQATTLLAVASMKKLLEESLSTVTECEGSQTGIKTEPTEEASEPEMKPNLTQLFYEKDEVPPIAADLTLEIKSWQLDTEALVEAGSQSTHIKDSLQISQKLSPLPTSNDTVPQPTGELSTLTTSNFIGNPKTEAPSSPRKTHRLRTNKKAGHQNCCSPEPPKLHHLPVDQVQCRAQEQCRNSNTPSSAQRYGCVGKEHGGLNSLQRKREYWKLMKRQQRARLKARQKDRQGDCSGRLFHKNIQVPGLVIINTVKCESPPAKLTLQPKPNIASLAAVTGIPTVLAVSPTTCNADTLQIKLPVNSVSGSSRNEQNNINGGPSKIVSAYVGGAQKTQQLALPGPQKCTSTSRNEDPVPSLPTLKPPDNPLSSINLQPIESPARTPNSTICPIRIPCTRLQNPTHMIQTPTKLSPISTMVPPKPIPGESQEEFLRRKREYWRIKKKEQRARKAIQDGGNNPRRASNNWKPILPVQHLPAQDSGQWVNSSEDSEHLMSTSVETDPESYPYSDYTAPIEDDSELLFADYENNNCEEGPVSDGVWRHRYLMDYDPLNQLLVCMVCGELQYSHSVEGVRAHIDEAHPDTMTLEPAEQRQILEAWDEQVSQRERFFTSQLQQHSTALTEGNRN